MAALREAVLRRLDVVVRGRIVSGLSHAGRIGYAASTSQPRGAAAEPQIVGGLKSGNLTDEGCAFDAMTKSERGGAVRTEVPARQADSGDVPGDRALRLIQQCRRQAQRFFLESGIVRVDEKEKFPRRVPPCGHQVFRVCLPQPCGLWHRQQFAGVG